MVEKKLKELCDINYGKDHKAVNDPSGAYPILGTGGLMGFAREKLFDGPSVLIGRKGSINKPQFASSPFWTVDTLYYTSNFNNVFPKWLYYYLSFIDLMRYNEATGLPSLNRNTLYHISILTPPLPEQKKIATILSTVDEAIQNTKAQIAQTKELKRGLMQKLFSEGIGHTEFKESKLGRIPKEWEVVRLGEVADVKGGFAFKSHLFKSEGNYQVLRIGNLYGGELRLDRVPVFIDTIDSRMIEFELLKDDLISTMTGTIGKRDFGYTIRIKSNDQLYLNQRVCRIRPTSIDSTFLEYTTDTKSYLDQFFESVSGGTGNQANIGTGSIANIFIKVPSEAQQKKIGSILYQVTHKINTLDNSEKYLESLKRGLMQKLLTGEVRVKI